MSLSVHASVSSRAPTEAAPMVSCLFDQQLMTVNLYHASNLLEVARFWCKITVFDGVVLSGKREALARALRHNLLLSSLDLFSLLRRHCSL